MTLESNRKLEVLVGIFCLFGLGLLGGLAVTFGRFGESVSDRYPLTLEFSNASGLLQGSNVLMAGAKIGRVTSPPRVLPEGKGVAIEVKIFEEVRIPEGSEFHVGSSGLLGDRFVDVRPPKGPAEGYLASGDTVRGERESGMGDLAREGTELVEDLQEVVAKLDKLFTKVNDEVLNEESTENLRKTFANLETATAGFATASEQFGEVMTDAREMVAGLKEATGGIGPVVDEAGGVMEDARGAVASIGKAASNVEQTLNEVSGLLQDIRSDEGVIGALLGDEALRDDLRGLISNLRRHGVLFYRDRDEAEEGDSSRFGPARGPRGPR